jgi:signal transduction histidine kinase
MASGLQTRWGSRATLWWGFAATIVLALAAGVVSVVEVQRSRTDVRALALTADRSSYLVGEVGRELTRLRVAALEMLVSPIAHAERKFPAVIEALEHHLRELEPLLEADEREAWRRFVPLLGRYRRQVAEAQARVEQGSHEEARVILTGRVARLAAEMQRELDRLVQVNQEQSALLLTAADGRLAQVRVIETGLAFVLAAGLALIWWTVLRTVARQQRELAAHVARIEASNHDLDAFAGRIAHDLRNALSPVALAAAALRGTRNPAATAESVAGQLERSVQRSSALIDGLLAFARAERMRESNPRASLGAVVRDVLDELRGHTAAVGATLDVDLPDVDVACPPGLLHVVAANLIGNALKFLAGCALRRLQIAAQRGNGWAELVVEDTGPGIPRDSLARIFEPFYRVPGNKAPGTGIGLATVRRIVEAYGGSVQVRSELGRGSTFRVRLPVVGDEERVADDVPGAAAASL